MTVWVLTVVTMLGALEHSEMFADGAACADAMFEFAEIEQFDARCHRVTHYVGDNA